MCSMNRCLKYVLLCLLGISNISKYFFWNVLLFIFTVAFMEIWVHSSICFMFYWQHWHMYAKIKSYIVILFFQISWWALRNDVLNQDLTHDPWTHLSPKDICRTLDILGIHPPIICSVCIFKPCLQYLSNLLLLTFVLGSPHWPRDQ